MFNEPTSNACRNGSGPYLRVESRGGRLPSSPQILVYGGSDGQYKTRAYSIAELITAEKSFIILAREY
jgi:hypothetical protein